MEIKGKVHCFFEQSGTFKNEFIKLGIPAEDYDIQNNFGQTDHVIDLFDQIEREYDKTRQDKTIFDDITKDDLIVAFFPCIYFSSLSQMEMSLTDVNKRKMPMNERYEFVYPCDSIYNSYTYLDNIVYVHMHILIKHTYICTIHVF